MSQIQIIEARKPEGAGKEAVAAYCRVSSDSEDQLNSYRNQVDYYTSMIAENENWELADIYADATDIIGLNRNSLRGKPV